MRRRSTLQAGLAAGLALAWPRLQAQQVDPLAPGTSLPGWEALDLQGGKSPVPAAGRPSIVNFWATWCPPCRTEMPLLLQLDEFYGDRVTLQLVNFKERQATVQRYMRDAGWNRPVLFDAQGQGAAAWGVKVFPTTFGFDAQGRARWRVRGEYDWSSAAAARLVETLLQ